MRLRRASIVVVMMATIVVVMAHAAPKPAPKGVSISFPRFSSSINCSLDGSSGAKPKQVCTPSENGDRVFFSFADVISARYQYKKKVQLWKKGLKYAASFSTSYTIEFRRSSDRVESDNFFSFGGGWAFAITPDQKVGSSGPESFGLFEINDKTGASLRGEASKTVAIEIDISRNSTVQEFEDPQIPHLGLDINSVKSVATAELGNFTKFVDRKIAVFIDYDASKELLQARLQNLGSPSTNNVIKPNKSKAKLYLSYSLPLAHFVNEQSYVGFSSRVPEDEDGTYVLYDWKFATVWVPVKKH